MKPNTSISNPSSNTAAQNNSVCRQTVLYMWCPHGN